MSESRIETDSLGKVKVPADRLEGAQTQRSLQHFGIDRDLIPHEMEVLPRIVVVGGGAAGLELVTRLGERLGRRSRASVTLVDGARAHLWKPLLHSVASGSIDTGEYEVDYLAQAHWRGFRYRFGNMVGLERARKEVHLGATFDAEGRQITPAGSVSYDTLVIAIGSKTNDFGIPGVAEFAVPLETPVQC